MTGQTATPVMAPRLESPGNARPNPVPVLIRFPNHPYTLPASLAVRLYCRRFAFAFTNDVEMELQLLGVWAAEQFKVTVVSFFDFIFNCWVHTVNFHFEMVRVGHITANRRPLVALFSSSHLHCTHSAQIQRHANELELGIGLL